MNEVLTLDLVAFEGLARKQLTAIRNTVFVQEQGVPPELEMDEYDQQAQHVIAYIDGDPVATGRILKDGHIGRIAVLKAVRGQGIGAAVVRLLMTYARDQGWPRVYLGSQLHAEAFYRALGFQRYGDVFMDAGIEHCWMQAKP